jgi:hypothetical protein
MASLPWERSGRCEGGTCVEAARFEDDIVVRDSKDPHGPLLRFTRSEWDAFIGGVQDGGFRFAD